MKKVSSKNLISALVAGVLMVGGNAVFAATQGTKGGTSTGSVDITAKIGSQVRISGLSDVDFSAAKADQDFTNTQSVCAWSNADDGGYSITAKADTSKDGKSFVLKDGDKNLIYSVGWKDSLKGDVTDLLTAEGKGLTGQKADSNGWSCSKGKTAQLKISITKDNVAEAGNGLYKGTLSLTVSAL